MAIVPLDDVELHCITSPSIDDRERPLVICVHGFPDSPHTWRHLLPALDDAGLRVVAPFLRGYAPSSLSTSGSYQAAASALDVVGLHDRFEGDERAILIGHDWGAPIVYGAASHEPRRWSRVVAMAVPPGTALAQAFLVDYDQLKRSWYMFFFQHALAEAVVGADDLTFIDRLWRDWSPGYDATADLTHVKDCLRAPENMAAALGYYRAALGDGYRDPAHARIQEASQAIPDQPTLYLHGAHDGCIGSSVADAARAQVGDHVTIEVVADVGHFLHLEDPSGINNRILEFLS